MYIAVVGNIGAGKTTLTNMLAKHYGWEPRFESVEDNPYLDDFYKDMKRWSFDLQVYFMNMRIHDIMDIAKSGETVIQDRCAFEDRYIFAPTLYEQGNLTERDFALYTELFDMMIKLVPQPDLVIYIRSSIGNLVNQIEKRNRGCESTMSIDYLSNLNNNYNDWISKYQGKVVTIDGDTCKFENNESDFEHVIEEINKALNN
jgi:deoxyadenosine/deoxycytidine kinase